MPKHIQKKKLYNNMLTYISDNGDVDLAIKGM